jgi:hypothetical protein
MSTSHYKYIRREFLNNEPEELNHTSYVMAFVENSHRGESLSDAMVHIADCRRVVVLNFFLSRPEGRIQSLKKIDLLLEVLSQFKKALVREAKIITRAETKDETDGGV